MTNEISTKKLNIKEINNEYYMNYHIIINIKKLFMNDVYYVK